jgi:hypothetical protein
VLVTTAATIHRLREDIMQDRQGGCLCGAVRYVLKGDLLAVAICHCRHCQRQSGSILSFNVVVRESDYDQRGETMVYVDKGDSGQPLYRHFCGRCGSPVFTKTAMAPGMVVVRAGTLDSMEGLQPTSEIYTDHAVKWLAPVAGAARSAQQ